MPPAEVVGGRFVAKIDEGGKTVLNAFHRRCAGAMRGAADARWE
jgi:hypothetical protein